MEHPPSNRGPRRGFPHAGRRAPQREAGPREMPQREAAVTKLTQSGFLKFPIPALRASPAELMPPPLERAPPDETAEFAEIGRRVAEAKRQLDDIPASDFEPLMRALDLYHGMKRTFREEFGFQFATNATLKMYEMLSQLGLVVCSSGAPTRARVFCNAELPGAFLEAINHYVRTLCPATGLEWLASSYYPETAAGRGDATILGDQYGIYAANRDRWLMGPRPNAMPAGPSDSLTGPSEVSGDVTDPDVVAALADGVHARFDTAAGLASGALLYTSDAGIDVSADYGRQEELTALVNYGQVLCGLLALAPGGHLVTKQYTFVTPFSRSLIGLVAALFDEACVVKPLTSRPANSEVYLVGKGFRGISPELADALLDRLGAYRNSELTPCDLAPLLGPALLGPVESALLRAARQIHGRQQVAFLNEAAGFYRRYAGQLPSLGRLLSRDAARVQEAWLLENPVRRIRADYQLAAGTH